MSKAEILDPPQGSVVNRRIPSVAGTPGEGPSSMIPAACFPLVILIWSEFQTFRILLELHLADTSVHLHAPNKYRVS